MMRSAGIIVAAGAGTRMDSGTPKQFMMLGGRPVLCHSLEAFEKSSVDEVIIVTDAAHVGFCRDEIAAKYGFSKVSAVIEGGEERYLSSLAGIRAAEHADIVLIHDGARPFVTADIINRNIETVCSGEPCITAIRAYETIKVSDGTGHIKETPRRDELWIAQTPQSFKRAEILSAYEKVLAAGGAAVYDDATVWEMAGGQDIVLIEGTRRNIKITTPEDMIIAEALVKNGC